MRYSLQSRFRGALLGAALGEIYGSQCQLLPANPPSLVGSNVDQESLTFAAEPRSTCGQIVVEGVQQFIESHRWNLETTNSPSRQRTNALPGSSDQIVGIAAVLPIALYFHDDLTQLRHQLRQAIAIGYSGLDSVVTGVEQPLTGLAYALAIALQEQLNPHELIADWLSELKLSASKDLKLTDPKLTDLSLNGLDLNDLNRDCLNLNYLNTVATWISQGMGVSTVAQTLQQWGSRSPITNLLKADADVNADAVELGKATEISSAIALWSFLNTPDDFRLSVMQAARLRYHPQVTCTLVGALSGAYNGLSGLPLDWRCALHRQVASTSALTQLWNVASEENVFQLADQLLADWAGLYKPSAVDTIANTLNWHHLAIAAPNVIRSR